jgi:hypothetical protein
MMNWLDTLLKKLPTFKGITWFFHVAANWSTFRDELDQYRLRIKDRDEWLKDEATRHEAEKERMKNEFNQKVNEMMKAAGGAYMDVIRGIINVHAESTYRLAIRYQLNPFEWSVERDQLGPALRAEIESLMARLPPPPPAPKTLGEIFARVTPATGSLSEAGRPATLKEAPESFGEKRISAFERLERQAESPAEAAAREERLKSLDQQRLSKKDKKDG